jgi:hypothetical protein
VREREIYNRGRMKVKVKVIHILANDNGGREIGNTAHWK